mgnify:CR=1 FL=1
MKLQKFTNQDPIYYYNTNEQVQIPDTYQEKPFRAMWVSNVVNIDLPTVEDIEKYKSKIIKILDTCEAYQLNTIIFQVRTNNDAFYASKLNPYSRYFTGKEGKEPPFDVLAWVISQAKKRAIAFHAWCNPYRVSMNGDLSVEGYLDTCDDLNYAKQHPDHLILSKTGQIILNPAKKEVKDFICSTILELIENYDVDGIHFDDYFYPYGGLDESHGDQEEYQSQKLSQELTLEDFRRYHVNDMIEQCYKTIKQYDASIQFGISPFGIWKNKKENVFGSNTAPGCTESYHALYADTVQWVKDEIIDYLVPQIYWEFGHDIAPFADICRFWVQVCKDSPVDLYIGHGAYRLGTKGEFLNPLEIVHQVKYANQFDTVKGNVFFTYKHFIDQKDAYPGMQALKKLFNGEKI